MANFGADCFGARLAVCGRMPIPVASFEFDRGETIMVALQAVSGDPAAASNVTARMKAVAWGQSEPDDDAPVAAEFSVSFVPAAGDVAAYWTLEIGAAASAALAPGKYHAAARYDVAGGAGATSSVSAGAGANGSGGGGGRATAGRDPGAAGGTTATFTDNSGGPNNGLTVGFGGGGGGGRSGATAAAGGAGGDGAGGGGGYTAGAGGRGWFVLQWDDGLGGGATPYSFGFVA